MYMICQLFLNEKTNLWIRYDFSVIKVIARSFQMTQILVITFRNVKWRDNVRKYLAQALVHKGCAVRVWWISWCSWNTSCTYGASFQTLFYCYTALFFQANLLLLKKKISDCNNHTLVNHNRAGTVSLFWVFGTVSRNSMNILLRTVWSYIYFSRTEVDS